MGLDHWCRLVAGHFWFSGVGLVRLVVWVVVKVWVGVVCWVWDFVALYGLAVAIWWVCVLWIKGGFLVVSGYFGDLSFLVVGWWCSVFGIWFGFWVYCVSFDFGDVCSAND